MKTIRFALLACVLAAGCMSVPQNDKERGERDLFRAQLIADPRVAAMLAQQPLQDIDVQGDRRSIRIFVNSPEVQVRSGDGRESTVPGNRYTPQEVRTIENVALELQKEIGIQRDILIHDDATGKEHRIFGAWWKL